MYHCAVNFYLFRLDESLQQAVTSLEPGSSLTFSFSFGENTEEQEWEKADVLLANMQGLDDADISRILALKRKEGAQLIALAGQEETEALLKEGAPAVDDIWRLPMTEAECLFHVTAWKQTFLAQKDYWETGQYLDTMINSIPSMVWFKDKKGAHLKVNDSFCRIVGKTREQIQGRGHYYIWDIEPEEYAKGEFICMESEYEVMEKRETCVFEENVKVGDELRQFDTYKSPLFDLDGSVMGTVGVARDVTNERRYQQMIIDNANTDFLTGLYNRRYLYQYIETMGTKPLAVYYLDLDNFKSVNDRYGHQVGDRALVLTKDILTKCMPEAVIARIGGDEFLVVQEGDVTQEEIGSNRSRLRDMLTEAYHAEEEFSGISASIGTSYSETGEKVVLDTLIEQADALMYQEKREKKGHR